jgi:hypothetical protein
MNWIKIATQVPPNDSEILYFDGRYIFMAYVNKAGSIGSCHYLCGKHDCKWLLEGCGCNLEPSPTHYWMPLPEKPK